MNVWLLQFAPSDPEIISLIIDYSSSDISNPISTISDVSASYPRDSLAEVKSTQSILATMVIKSKNLVRG